MTTLTPEREAEIRAVHALARHTRWPWDAWQRDVRDLLAALDATRAELAEVRAADIERARLALLLETATADAKRWEARAYEVRSERDAHARDLALLAEVRAMPETRQVVADLQRAVDAPGAGDWDEESVRRTRMFVRLLRGEG
jgi:hypothetical protein